jgi:hypothetical protein
MVIDFLSINSMRLGDKRYLQFNVVCYSILWSIWRNRIYNSVYHEKLVGYETSLADDHVISEKVDVAIPRSRMGDGR